MDIWMVVVLMVLTFIVGLDIGFCLGKRKVAMELMPKVTDLMKEVMVYKTSVEKEMQKLREISLRRGDNGKGE